MTPWVITGAILMTAVKYVIPTFTAEIAQHIVFQNKAICMVIMTAMLRMVVRSATVTGMEETVACIVKDEMTPKVITSVMRQMGVSVVTKIGTVLYVLCTVVQGTITGGITSVTSEQGGEYVFQDGMGSFVTRVSKCDVRSSSEMGTRVWKGWGSDHNNPAF